MSISQITLLILGLLSALGIAAGGFGYLVKSFRNGSNDAVQFWKDQANEYKEMMKVKDERSDSKIQALTKEVGELTGQLKSEKEQNTRLEKIFQGRNPEMEAFMKYMVESSEKHSETHNAMIKILTDLHGMSASNHKLLEEENKKELKVESTVTKQ